MLSNLGTIYTAKMFGAAALLALAGCTDPKGPGDDSDSACLSDCDGADAGGGDGAADGSDGSPDGGDGGDGSDVPYLSITSIYPLADATNVPVDVVLEATFVADRALTDENVAFWLFLPPDYDDPVPTTAEIFDEGLTAEGRVHRATSTPDNSLLYAASYYSDLLVGYSSVELGVGWEFTTTAE